MAKKSIIKDIVSIGKYFKQKAQKAPSTYASGGAKGIAKAAGKEVGGLAKRAGKEFLRAFLSANFGMKDKKGKLGLAGKALQAGIKKEGTATDSVPMPTMESPTTVSRVSNPTIATISNQLDTLVETANRIGLAIKNQQDALNDQMAQAKRVAREEQIESTVGAAVPESVQGNTSDSLSPLGDIISSLEDKINDLIDVIDDKIDDGGGGGLSGFFGGKGKKPRLTRAQVTTNKAGQSIWKAGTIDPATGKKIGGQFIKRETLESLSKPSLLSRAFSATKTGLVGGATRIAASAPVSAIASTRLAQLIGGGVKAAGSSVASRVMDKSALAVAVKKVAGPLIEKGLGKTVLKSIPIIGAGIGILSAASRLVQGDVIGAGLDLTSGLGGPLTAIPAFIASLARDSYSGVYGIQPEDDPEFGSRMSALKEVLEDIVKSYLGQSIKPKTPPTAMQVAEVETPKPLTPQQDGAKEPKAPPTSGAAAPTMAESGSSGSSAPAPVEQATSGAAAQVTPSASTGEKIAPKPVEIEQSAAEFIQSQELAVADEWSAYGFDPNLGRFMPQNASTYRGGAQGIGRIPDPIYRATNLEPLKKTLYFNY